MRKYRKKVKPFAIETARFFWEFWQLIKKELG